MCKHTTYFVLNLFIYVFVFSNISLDYQICIHIGRCTPKYICICIGLKNGILINLYVPKKNLT